MRSLKLNCTDCAAFVASRGARSVTTYFEDLTLIKAKDRGGLIKPNPILTQICIACEKSVQSAVSRHGISSNIHKAVGTQTLSYMLHNTIHLSFCCAIHSTTLIKTIISRYATIRVHHETTKLESNKDNLRQKLSRLVVFRHV